MTDDREYAADIAYLRGLGDYMHEMYGPQLPQPDGPTIELELLFDLTFEQYWALVVPWTAPAFEDLWAAA